MHLSESSSTTRQSTQDDPLDQPPAAAQAVDASSQRRFEQAVDVQVCGFCTMAFYAQLSRAGSGARVRPVLCRARIRGRQEVVVAWSRPGSWWSPPFNGAGHLLATPFQGGQMHATWPQPSRRPSRTGVAPAARAAVVCRKSGATVLGLLRRAIFAAQRCLEALVAGD